MPSKRSALCLMILPGVLACATAAAVEPLPAAAAHALAPLAPEGRWVTRIELRRNGYDHRYNSQGEREPLAAAFDGITLDAAVFPALAALGAGATLGTTALASEVAIERAELAFGYGVTPDLTLGATINYGRTETQVAFDLSGGNTGWNPSFNPSSPIGPSNFPFAPVGGGAAAPMDAAGLNQILTSPVFGYGYMPAASTETTELGNTLIGVLWRSLRTDRTALVWGLGYRFGLSDGDNPDNLFDVPLDDGSNDLIGQVEYFRNWGAIDLRAMVKRTLQRADKKTMRVPQPGAILAAEASKESLARNLGDAWEYDLELGRGLGDWRLSATWHRWDKSADRYTSPSGQDTTALETNTHIDTNQWRLAVSWSGINTWRRGLMPMPLIAKLEMQETYEGHNMVDVRDVYLFLTTFF